MKIFLKFIKELIEYISEQVIMNSITDPKILNKDIFNIGIAIVIFLFFLGISIVMYVIIKAIIKQFF
jgi:hypothetical protein